MAIEVAMWLPVLLLLLMGMEQFGKITYQYYQLKKNLYSAAQYLARQQGVDFCSLTSDANVLAAIRFAMTGGTDGTATSQFPSLTTDTILVRTECVDATSGTLSTCSTSGCGGTVVVGAQRPDYIVISIPDGYQVTPKIPYMTLDPILLKPLVRVPFGGT
jgi:Flp pilus assembly protein TadG